MITHYSDPHISREILIKARAILSERGWTQRVMAKTAEGIEVHHSDPEACQFCALGAVFRAVVEMGPYEAGTIIPKDTAMARSAAIGALDLVAHQHISVFNDTHATSKEEVLTVFDMAIGLYEMPT